MAGGERPGTIDVPETSSAPRLRDWEAKLRSATEDILKYGIDQRYKDKTKEKIIELLPENNDEIRILMNANDFTISRVLPRFGRRNKLYYEPSVVAIGPNHRGKEGLQAMEEHKWCHLNSFLQRRSTLHGETLEVSTETCINLLIGFRDKARMFYFEDTKMEDKVFVEMLLLDGCFIVEMILRWYDQKDMISYHSWFSRQIWEDLLLFENQLPFFILDNLYKAVQNTREENFIYIAQNYMQDRTLPTEMKTKEDMEFDRRIERELESWLEVEIGREMDWRVEHKMGMKIEIGDDSEFDMEITSIEQLEREQKQLLWKQLEQNRDQVRERDRLMEMYMRIIMEKKTEKEMMLRTEMEMKRQKERERERELEREREIEIEMERKIEQIIRERELVEIERERVQMNLAMNEVKQVLAMEREIQTARIAERETEQEMRPGIEIDWEKKIKRERERRRVEIEKRREKEKERRLKRGMSMRTVLGLESERERKMVRKMERILKRVVIPRDKISHLLQLFYLSTISKPFDRDQKKITIVDQIIYSLRWLNPLMLLSLVIACCRSYSAGHNYTEIQRAIKIPSATKLRDAGVTFKAKQSNNFMDITFDHGVLEIPPITLDSQRKCRMMNLIAFEQSNHGSYVLTSYAEFMDNIIDTEDDVEILQQAGIIISYLRDNQEVALFFNQLSEHKAISEQHMLTPVMEKIKKYAEVDRHRWRAYLCGHYFSNPWTIISLIAAGVLLILTILQTAYTMQGYYHPHS